MLGQMRISSCKGVVNTAMLVYWLCDERLIYSIVYQFPVNTVSLLVITNTLLVFALVQKGIINIVASTFMFQRALTDLRKPSGAYVCNHYCIFRWASFASQLPPSHPILPLVWQRFFLLYLQRPRLEPGYSVCVYCTVNYVCIVNYNFVCALLVCVACVV